MVNPDWRILFPQALVEVLYQHNSDHNPLLLSCSKLVVDAWLSRPEYPNLVVDAWQGRTLQVMSFISLRKVKEETTIFNSQVFGNIFKRKRQLQAWIQGVHRVLDVRVYASLVSLEKELEKLYNDVLYQKEVLWYQKSRERWVKLGNKNTKFFHTQITIKRRRNRIYGLMINGNWRTEKEVLKRKVMLYFKSLFLESIELSTFQFIHAKYSCLESTSYGDSSSYS